MKNISMKNTYCNKGKTTKITYRKPVKQKVNQGRGKRMPCKVLTKEQINELYSK